MNKYVIPFILIALGVLMSTDTFLKMDEFVVACFNWCAFLFTLSCINMGSIKSKRKNIISLFIRTLLQICGIIAFLLVIIDEQFKYYDLIYSVITGTNPNSLLLIGLAATLISINAAQDFNANKEKSTENKIRDLEKDINILKSEYLDCKDKSTKSKYEIEKLLNENKKLKKALEESLNSLDQQNF